MLSGRCECRAVRYRVADEFLYAANCHCSNCRAGTGSAFKPFAGIERNKLESHRGSRPTARLGRRQGRTTRGAASAAPCSTRWCATAPTCTWRLGSLEHSPSIRPTEHIFVGSKADLVRDHRRLASVGGVLGRLVDPQRRAAGTRARAYARQGQGPRTSPPKRALPMRRPSPVPNKLGRRNYTVLSVRKVRRAETPSDQFSHTRTPRSTLERCLPYRKWRRGPPKKSGTRGTQFFCSTTSTPSLTFGSLATPGTGVSALKELAR